MERKLVTVRQVSELVPIEGADNIEVAKVDGWQCVVKKGEFSPGDFGVYFEIDSFIPFGEFDNRERFDFLAKNKINWQGKEGVRIKTIRLRGQLSQGLLLPVAIDSVQHLHCMHAWENNEDISSVFGVEKWEPNIPAQLAGKVRGNFPGFIRKTDQERIQNIYNKVAQRNDDYEVTIKLDGSSMTVYRKDGQFGVCSRNLDLIETEDNAFWRVARQLKIEERMIEMGYDNIAIQGELMGPGVQGNKEKLTELKFFVFDIFDIENQTYLDSYSRDVNVMRLGLDHVPVLNVDMSMNMTLDELLAFAEGPSYNPDVTREGLVWKSYQDPNFSWKVISNKFLLKHGE